MVKEEQGVYSSMTNAAKADAIAHATKKVITEKMEEDPAFYQKFSKLIQQAIDEYRAKAISDLAYLKKVTDIRAKVVSREHEDVPDKIRGKEDAQAFYGVIKPYFDANHLDPAASEDVSADAALAIQDILKRNWKVQFWDDWDAQKRVMNDIDDYLYDEIRGNRGIGLTTEVMDEIIERSMQLARHRMPL